MFGTYRLVLACLVTLSHLGFQGGGFNPGQWAVICFYVLSGFLMDRQFKKLSPDGGSTAFYVDRLLRVLPLYWVVLCVGRHVMGLTALDFWSNFALFPENFATFTHTHAVSPAWSLACEAQFYLLVPLLAILPGSARATILFLSILIFIGSLLLPYSSFWAYVAVPGVLFTFLSGILINRGERDVLSASVTALAFIFIFGVFSKWHGWTLPVGININVCIGYLVAVPMTLFLGRLSPKNKIDQFFGLLSYPLFLVHPFITTLCSPDSHSHKIPGMLGILGMSLAAAGLLVVLVEKPFDHLRYRARRWVRAPNPESTFIPSKPEVSAS